MSGKAKAVARGFTWDDYRTWPADERWEIVDGEAYAMSPAPTLRHQDISREMTLQMGPFFAGRLCALYVTPTDVKLSDHDIVQPDLLVVCEKEKRKPTHIEGAPTLVVEILSPVTALHDRARKLRLYAAHGVREVWLVTPYPSAVEVFVLTGERYSLEAVYGKDETLASVAFPDLKVVLTKVFDFPLEPGEEPPMVKEGRPPPYGKRPVPQTSSVT
jgi:Uma2 family endonuclease